MAQMISKFVEQLHDSPLLEYIFFSKFRFKLSYYILEKQTTDKEHFSEVSHKLQNFAMAHYCYFKYLTIFSSIFRMIFH